VVEISAQRAAKALELGATSATDPSKEDAGARIRASSAEGVDVAVEVTGAPAVMQQCIDASRSDGETIIVSIWEKPASFRPNTVVLKARNLKGIIAYRDIFPAVMELMLQGYFGADRLVTKRIALKDIIEEGFEALVREKSDQNTRSSRGITICSMAIPPGAR
jgi:(R,R)-butanediol dehydrogenase/meso-butanediol dehydrogenase/diacetyl reductase